MGYMLAIWCRSFWVLAGYCLALVILADFLFFDHTIGWTMALFGSLLLAAVLLRAGRYPLRSSWGWLHLIVILGLLVSLVENAALLPTLLGLLAIVSLSMISRSGFPESMAAWIKEMALFTVAFWVHILRDIRLIQRWRKSHPGRTTRSFRPFAQWTIAIGITALFVALFAAANPIISNWFSRLGEWFSEFFEFLTVDRILFWLIVGVFSWGLLRQRLRQGVMRFAATPICAISQNVSAESAMDRWLGPGLVVRCLVLFNLAFAVQTVLDAMYLFGNATLPEGMTYAAYAHRGAYPLMFTALLAGLFVLITFRAGSRTQNSRLCKSLVYFWLAQNVFLIFNSIWRLGLYVDVYSLTRLRVAAGLWMVLVTMGLLWITLKIITARNNHWLLKMNALTLGLLLYACCFANIDGYIADFNVRHCREAASDPLAAPLDIAYLEHLGVSSLPALDWLQQQTAGKDIIIAMPPPHYQRYDSRSSVEQISVDEAARRIQTRLKRQLKKDMADWRGWTARRARLAAVYLSADTD